MGFGQTPRSARPALSSFVKPAAAPVYVRPPVPPPQTHAAESFDIRTVTYRDPTREAERLTRLTATLGREPTEEELAASRVAGEAELPTRELSALLQRIKDESGRVPTSLELLEAREAAGLAMPVFALSIGPRPTPPCTPRSPRYRSAPSTPRGTRQLSPPAGSITRWGASTPSYRSAPGTGPTTATFPRKPPPSEPATCPFYGSPAAGRLRGRPSSARGAETSVTPAPATPRTLQPQLDFAAATPRTRPTATWPRSDKHASLETRPGLAPFRHVPPPHFPNSVCMESARNRSPAQLFRNDALFAAERDIHKLAGTPSHQVYKQIDTLCQGANHARLPKATKEQLAYDDLAHSIDPSVAAALVCRNARRRFFIESFHYVESVGLVGCKSSDTRRILRRSTEGPD